MISEINNALSIDTGGRRIGLTNDFSPALRGVMSDASDYYLLGYESPQVRPDGKFHDIDVRVRRKGVRVIARNGYWSPSPEEASTATAAPAAPPIPPEVSEALGAARRDAPRSACSTGSASRRSTQGESRVSIIFEPATAESRWRRHRVHVDVTLPGGATATHARGGGRGRLAARGHVAAWTSDRSPDREGPAGEVIDTWSRHAVVPAAEARAAGSARPSCCAAADGLAVSRRCAGDGCPPPARRFRRGDGSSSPAARRRRSAGGRCAAPEP